MNAQFVRDARLEMVLGFINDQPFSPEDNSTIFEWNLLPQIRDKTVQRQLVAHGYQVEMVGHTQAKVTRTKK